MSQSVRLTQWGNSIGVRLPKDMVNALGLEAGGIPGLECVHHAPGEARRVKLPFFATLVLNF